MGRLRAIGLLAGSLAFVAIGLVIANGGAGVDRALGLACAAFSGAGAIVGAIQLAPAETPLPDGHGVTLIRPRRAELIGLCTAGVLMAAVTPFAVRAGVGDESGVASRTLSIAGVLVFASAAVACLVRLVRPRALYRLDHVGVSSLAAGKAWFVPWRAIRGIDAMGVHGQYFLALDVDPSAAPVGGVPHKAKRTEGFPAFTIGPQGSSVRFDVFAQIVQRYWERGRLMQAHN